MNKDKASTNAVIRPSNDPPQLLPGDTLGGKFYVCQGASAKNKHQNQPPKQVQIRKIKKNPW